MVRIDPNDPRLSEAFRGRLLEALGTLPEAESKNKGKAKVKKDQVKEVNAKPIYVILAVAVLLLDLSMLLIPMVAALVYK